MSKRWLWVGLPIVAMGCAAPSGPVGAERDDPLPENDDAISPYARHPPGPPSLCVVGQRISTFHGNYLTLPVRCIPDDLLEPGTPVEDDALDPETAVEEPAIEEIDERAASQFR
jgi:hypothetical protein